MIRLGVHTMFQIMKGKIPVVVSCEWLKQCVNSVGKHFKLLDASTWTSQHSGKEDFVRAHIPGAIFYDQHRCVHPTPTLVRNFPDPECYQYYLRSLGVSADSHLVVYARGDLFNATRAWWTIRAMGHPFVSVLNGGLEQWEAEGGETETGDSQYNGPEGSVEVSLNHDIIKTFPDMIEMALNGGSQLIDTRYKENFLGILPEPAETTVRALRSVNLPLPEKINRGHIPGAINLHVSCFKTNKGTLKSKDELDQFFENADIDLKRPLTIMCYNGLNACVPALAAAWLGKDDAALYYGSWTEYGQRADRSLCQT